MPQQRNHVRPKFCAFLPSILQSLVATGQASGWISGGGAVQRRHLFGMWRSPATAGAGINASIFEKSSAVRTRSSDSGASCTLYRLRAPTGGTHCEIGRRAQPARKALCAENLPHRECLRDFGAIKTGFTELKFSSGLLYANLLSILQTRDEEIAVTNLSSEGRVLDRFHRLFTLLIVD